jgi:hypothetical protein
LGQVAGDMLGLLSKSQRGSENSSEYSEVYVCRPCTLGQDLFTL